MNMRRRTHTEAHRLIQTITTHIYRTVPNKGNILNPFNLNKANQWPIMCLLSALNRSTVYLSVATVDEYNL